MISFVWSAKYPFLAGAGGSENYTAGHIRELNRRGIPARLITIGHGNNDGREDFPDIEFLAIDDKKELEELDDTLVFVTYPLDVKTRHPAYAILHCPPPMYARNDKQYNLRAFKGKRLVTSSRFAAGLWRRQLRSHTGRMPTVYPFASPAFAKADRPKPRTGTRRVLFAGRLTPDKGIYTLMAALHMDELADLDYKITVTTSGAHTDEGKIILKLVKAHPMIRVVESRKTPEGMARLMAQHDIVVMPSTDIYWQELFGFVSVEAQHAGCRVVASRSGGLPETEIGGLMLVKPDNPKTLAAGLAKAIKLGPLTTRERAKAVRKFTLEESVDSLLKVIRYTGQKQQTPKRAKPGMVPGLQPLLSMTQNKTKGMMYRTSRLRSH
jgi:D-inositol-3-phosphate glycosyltransferase